MSRSRQSTLEKISVIKSNIKHHHIMNAAKAHQIAQAEFKGAARVAVTPAGHDVIVVAGIWGSGLSLAGHTEDDDIHISIGDTEGENNYATLAIDAKHQVAISNTLTGVCAYGVRSSLADALVLADHFKSLDEAGTLESKKY
jgi:hypothetical protein